MKKQILRMWRNWRFKRGLRKLSDETLEKALRIALKCDRVHTEGETVGRIGGRDNLMEGIFLMSQAIQAEIRLHTEVVNGHFMGDWSFNPKSMKDFPE